MRQTKLNFVLGPAGSGKTYQFIESVRQHLARDPEGLPLLFLAPKQATFQIEAQLLRDEQLEGFTRLQILSFPRLAEYVLSEFAPDQTQILSEDGRLMILRSLLGRHADELRAFKSVANFPSFADEISSLLVDLQRHHIDASFLRKLLLRSDLPKPLANKLHDLALIAARYREWLAQSNLKDAEFLLDLATTQLKQLSSATALANRFFIQELWLDGFAEMTPQELALLTAIIPHCQTANLAYCVDPEQLNPSSWLNLWTATSEAFHRCEHQVTHLDSVDSTRVLLKRSPEISRFQNSQELQHLEANWATPKPFRAESTEGAGDLEIVQCQSREDEVIHAARRILEAARDKKTRFRDIAVYVRHLEDYATEIKQIFNRYEIPHFIDQRESINHHPAIVLTRCALRLAAFHWRTDDFIAALKTQLITPALDQVHELENAAIEHGWEGTQWQRSIEADDQRLRHLESFRRQVIRPFTAFTNALTDSATSNKPQISGLRLIELLRTFWESSNLQASLEQWERDEDTASGEYAHSPKAIHSGVWEELQIWAENVELAFADTHRPLRDWLPILEAGLTHLTVGVIPPTTDQVIIGSVDRSRSPNMSLALVLGLNEGVFPDLPKPHPILTEPERQLLGPQFDNLVPPVKRALATERFYAYIACTRATHSLIVSYATQTADGNPLTPSSIVTHLQRLLPDATQSRFSKQSPLKDTQHVSELMPPLFAQMASQGQVPKWAQWIEFLNPNDWSDPKYQANRSEPNTIAPALARQLYTNEEAIFPTSVSRLEQFAACPFRFFIHSGLRADERQEFQIDQKRIGSFQHLILETFHNEIEATGQTWRQVPPTDACNRIERIALRAAKDFNHGIFINSAEALFSLESIIQRLQEFIRILIEWMAQYEFDPKVVELGFGGKSDSIGPWMVPIDQGQMAFVGKIDRLDVCQDDESPGANAVIIDYKSSGKKLDPVLLYHGVQLQLLAYLNVVSQLPKIGEQLETGPLYPAGVFFVPLKGYSPRQPTRDLARLSHNDERPSAFQHIGCFDIASLRQLDNRSGCSKGDQFQYQLKRDGTPKKTAWHVMSTAVFRSTMERTETSIQVMGNRILAGEIGVDPYQHRGQTACLYCPYASVCRIDPAEHPFRTLAIPDEEPTPA